MGQQGKSSKTPPAYGVFYWLKTPPAPSITPGARYTGYLVWTVPVARRDSWPLPLCWLQVSLLYRGGVLCRSYTVIGALTQSRLMSRRVPEVNLDTPRAAKPPCLSWFRISLRACQAWVAKTLPRWQRGDTVARDNNNLYDSLENINKMKRNKLTFFFYLFLTLHNLLPTTERKLIAGPDNSFSVISQLS